MRILRISIMPLLIIVGVGACAGRQAAPPAPPTPQQASTAPPPAAPVTPEVALRAQVARFWDARVKGDVAEQYGVLEPEARERVTLTAFVRSRRTFDFKSYEIQSVNVAGDRGSAKVKYTFALRVVHLSGFGPWTNETTELWMLRDGVWYRPYIQTETAIPPASAPR